MPKEKGNILGWIWKIGINYGMAKMKKPISKDRFFLGMAINFYIGSIVYAAILTPSTIL